MSFNGQHKPNQTEDSQEHVYFIFSSQPIISRESTIVTYIIFKSKDKTMSDRIV